MELHKILFFKPGAIGDLLHTLPALRALRERFPTAQVTAIVSPGQDALIDGTGVADSVRTFDKSRYKKSVRDFLLFAKQLRHERFDLFVDMQPSLRSMFLRGLSGAKMVLAYRKQKRFSGRGGRMHAVENFMATLRPLGIDAPVVRIELPVKADAAARVDGFLSRRGVDGTRPLVALNCSVGAARPARNWFPERFAELADRLEGERGLSVVFVGGPEDRKFVASIIAGMKTRAVSLAGELSLPETAALLARCRCLVSSDTGPLHLATAVGTPVIGLYGSTDAKRTGPVGPGHQVISKALDCVPCEEKSCPLRSTACMAAITVEEVISAVKKVLG
jgi:lipopolysaccharide heptosyltransferase II